MSIENPKMCVQLIADWISSVGEPVKRRDICERFDLHRYDWEVIKRQIESSQDPIKIHGTRKGRKYYVEGIYSNAECARKAGFSPKVANTIASHLLSGKKYPQVLEYIKELIFLMKRKLMKE